MKSLCVLGALMFALSAAAQTSRIPAREASNHIGEFATVCGTVETAHFAYRSKGQPTFLDFDAPYPNEDFSVVIWGSDRTNFSIRPEVAYRDKAICVTGQISTYRGAPQVIVREPNQIER